MRFKGKTLTKEQAELVKVDGALSGEDLMAKYKILTGGEHPVCTRKLWEPDRDKVANLPEHPNQNYASWLFSRLKYMVNDPMDV